MFTCSVKREKAGMGRESGKLRSRTKHKGKTKFEEYLDMETGMRNPGLSAEEDLELERKLAKKLKVKAGKLRGEDDGINVFFEGIDSIVDSPGEEEFPFSEEFSVEPIKKKPLGNKRKKRKSLDQTPNGEIDSTDVDLAPVESSEADVEVEKTSKKNKKRQKKKMLEQHQDVVIDETIAGDDSMPVESPCAEVAVEKVPVKAQKYVAPSLRLRKQNEPEDHTQLRRRVRGVEVV